MGLHPKFGAKLRIITETDEKNDKIVVRLYERPLSCLFVIWYIKMLFHVTDVRNHHHKGDEEHHELHGTSMSVGYLTKRLVFFVDCFKK